jgi:hypothetical protein
VPKYIRNVQDHETEISQGSLFGKKQPWTIKEKINYNSPVINVSITEKHWW